MRFLRRLCLIGSALLALWSSAALAVEIGPSLAKFTTDRFPDTQRAVEEVAASGHPNAALILEALSEGRLGWRLPDRLVIVRDASGAWKNAATDEVVEGIGSANLKTVRLNNGVRRAVETAMGGLTLLSPDPAKRLDAARSVFKSRTASALPTVRTALERERDPKIRAALLHAQAAIVLLAADAPEIDRLTAVAAIVEKGDLEAQTLLRSMPATAPPRLVDAAAKGVKEIEAHLAMLENVQAVFYGISLGSVLLLAAIGLAITFGVMGIINMAHGEMVMIGAYATFVVQDLIRTKAPGLFDYSLVIALPIAFLVAGGVGVIIERTVIRFLYGRPLETLLATWGVSLILQQAVRSLFGPTNREVGNPGFMSGSFEVMGIALTWNRLWIVVFSLAVFATLLLVMKFTDFGLKMRAVVQNRRMAASMGVRTSAVDALTFGLGCGIAGIAGVALSQIDNVSPNLGQSYIIDSFMVVVFGGVGNLWGTLVAAMTLGIANKVLEPYAGAVLGKILVLVFIILFIQKRPRGLFALKGRAVEA
jgi:urea transport system permease protein